MRKLEAVRDLGNGDGVSALDRDVVFQKLDHAAAVRAQLLALREEHLGRLGVAGTEGRQAGPGRNLRLRAPDQPLQRLGAGSRLAVVLLNGAERGYRHLAVAAHGPGRLQ